MWHFITFHCQRVGVLAVHVVGHLDHAVAHRRPARLVVGVENEEGDSGALADDTVFETVFFTVEVDVAAVKIEPYRRELDSAIRQCGRQ